MLNNYHIFLSSLKEKIRKERLRVVLASNAALVMLYWDIGRSILKKQNEEGWGSRVIDRLSSDLSREFPDMKGFSPRNLKYMRSFGIAWPDKLIVQRVIAQLPWRSNIALIDKLKKPEERLWYAMKTIKHGWSQPILCLQIEAQAHKREGKATNNFSLALTSVDSDMAKEVFKDPYLFDFLGTADIRREKEVEQALVDHIQRFLLELGQGFAFVGRQVHLELGGNDYYIDLLFYHLKLRCYIIIELKAGDFVPEYVGKMNMYLSVVDDILRHPDDNPSIGLLLVKRKNKMIAEYALSGYTKPIGVAQWETKITKSLPKELKSNLPAIEEIEKELSKGKFMP
ncbi:MAG: PDDEXK nuclease domain-containing protein [Candidatus Omnitrophica bacterium]|nr:PDDEXK nuclease domain-containing protein [Candidatus Omnitrophota bacterium]